MIEKWLKWNVVQLKRPWTKWLLKIWYLVLTKVNGIDYLRS